MKALERVAMNQNNSKITKLATIQLEYMKMLERGETINNSKLIADFAMYTIQDVDIEINLPNVFGLVEESEIEFLEEKIANTLEAFLDYCVFIGNTELESTYIIPDDVNMINMRFALPIHKYDRLEAIASDYNITIDEAVLAIVFIVWNGFVICNELELGRLNGNNTVPYIEPMLETKKLSPFIEEDEIPF